MGNSNGKATTVKSTFSRQTSIAIDINADVGIIWNLLTDAENYPRWNSTVTSIAGKIAPGEKIKLKSTLHAKRTFSLTVREFEKEKRLVWGGGQGTREYTLSKAIDGSVTVSMTEKIGGLMFPLYASMIPSFDKSFEAFAADLKRAAENQIK